MRWKIIGVPRGVYRWCKCEWRPGAVHPIMAVMNAGMAALGVWGGPLGMVLSVGYQIGMDPKYNAPPGSFSRPLSIAPSDATSVYPSGSQGAYQSWYDYYIK